MPLTDQDRIATERQKPRIVMLWRALTALRSTVSFMNTGAHPDDEMSDLLAALRFRDGIDISYACSTRGEGGQNDIGTETTEALGTLRTAEMEAACDRLDLRMYWLSQTPTDSIFDFGFSKSGKETLEKWSRDRTLARFVDVIRTERPDIICPTFLDVPGQHGHHRAMTEAAHEVMSLAADPGYTGSDLPPWQIKKLYLPAWSGAGQAYDDDLPPPDATLTVAGRDHDPVTGWSFAHIGQQSRAMHATQAMGRWVAPGAERDFPLHLAATRTDGPDLTLFSGLAHTLRDLDAPAIASHLHAAQDACDAAISSFPSFDEVLIHAADALKAVQLAIAGCPAERRDAIAHKLRRKEQQLGHVIALAAGVSYRAQISHDMVYQDTTITYAEELVPGAAQVHTTPLLPAGWDVTAQGLRITADAGLSDPYPAIYLPGSPDAPCMALDMTVHGVSTTLRQAFETPPLVLPRHAVSITPQADVLNLAAPRRQVSVKVSDISPPGAAIGVKVPNGWQVDVQGDVVTITAPEDVAAGLYELPLTLDGAAAQQVQVIHERHTQPRAWCRPAALQLRVVQAILPETRVGYVGGGNDRVGHWLERMGVPLHDLSDAPLNAQRLAEIDTLVIGIFAMKFRKGLAAAMPQIHDWVREGGTLVTLYHRPWDNWDPDTTPPHRIEIGQPSLRWRVTDPAANVDLRAPDHPLLHQPNTIGPADWTGWHKERGLYFAKDWDAAYTPLIAMNDKGEPPLSGSWLVADVGRGRHVHTALILHHQMEKLTPGAFRIMANLLAKRG